MISKSVLGWRRSLRLRGLSTSLVLGNLALGFCPHAQALQNFSTKTGQWQLEATQKGFFTEANYDDQGQISRLAPGHSYKHFSFEVEGSYNLTDALSFSARVGLAHAISTDNAITREATLPTEAGVGAQYLLDAGFFWLGPELTFNYPLSSFGSNADDVLVSEGTWLATTKLNAFRFWSRRTQSFGSVGYAYPGNDSAVLMPWSLGSRVRLARPWLGLVFEGYRTIQPDLQPKAFRAATTNRVDGGSLYFYSHNPSSSAVTAFIELPWAKTWTFRLAGGTTLAGSNSAQGAFYILTLVYGDGPGAPGGGSSITDYLHVEKKYQQRKKRDDIRLKQFQFVPDSEDQQLFPEETR